MEKNFGSPVPKLNFELINIDVIDSKKPAQDPNNYPSARAERIFETKEIEISPVPVLSENIFGKIPTFNEIRQSQKSGIDEMMSPNFLSLKQIEVPQMVSASKISNP